MIYKILFSGLLSLASVNALGAAPRSPAKTIPEVEDTPEMREKLSQEILAVTLSGDQIKNAFKQSTQMMMKDLPEETTKSTQALLEKFFSWEKLEKKFTKIYADVFTARELQDIIAFYKSEVGKNFIAKQPDLMSKTMTMIQEINNEMKPYLMEELKKAHDKKAAATTDEK